MKSILSLALCLLTSALFAQPDSCTMTSKQYNQGSFSGDDFLQADGGIVVDSTITLSDEAIDLETLVLGLDQPFYVDYLSEGAGASHLFGFFFYDIDTNKNGVPDFFETGPTDDLDGDGLVNEDDLDDDNDGIPDALDREPAGINSMPASHFRLGATAAAAGMHPGDYWQFVPNSTISFTKADNSTVDIFEMPGAHLYVDNDGNEIPDILQYRQGTNRIPPYATDAGTRATHVQHGEYPGLLGSFLYPGTPGDTTDDRYHWTGSTIFYIADDDGGSTQTNLYNNHSPYGTGTYRDYYGSTNGQPDYDIYGTTDINSSLIPETLKNNDGTALLDARNEEMWRYRWYRSNVSGVREMVFFLTVFWGSGGSNVNTYYSKTGYNLDTPPNNNRNGATTGDNYGGWTGRQNWFPEFRNRSEHDELVDNVFGSGNGTLEWEDVATWPADQTVGPTIKASAPAGATQEWVDQWENLTSTRRVIQYRALSDWFNGTAVDANDLINGRYDINMSLEGDSSVIRAVNGNMSHLMVGAPTDQKTAWLVGWEDLFRGGDKDYEDVVFYVKREGGGQLQSTNVAEGLTDQFEDPSLSQITFSFTDNFTEDKWGTEGTYINYYYRLATTDDWIPLLSGQHERTVDLFQLDSGGETVESAGEVTRTVTVQVTNKRTEIFWKVEMASDRLDVFRPEVLDAAVEYQTLVHDFYFNSAIIPSSNINYIAAHETPDLSFPENKNRGHLFAQQTFEHGNPPDPIQVADGDSPERTPMSQPVYPFRWNAGVSMREDLLAGTDRTIYTFTTDNPDTVLANNLVRKSIERNVVDLDILDAFELSSGKNNGIWIDNYHAPDAAAQNKVAAGLWLQNWIHGYTDALIQESPLDVVDPGVKRDWILGGINRASPTVYRALGVPSWITGTAVPVATKRDFLEFMESDAQKNAPTRILIGTEGGMIHCIDAGTWVGTPKVGPPPDEIEYEFADGHYAGENYGTGREVWAMLPGHLLDDIKYNYTGANNITAAIDASAVTAAIKGPNGWRRIAVFSQGFNGGRETINGQTRVGNVVFALDVTNIDDPIPMWRRADLNAQDLINPVAMGWAEIGGSPRWIVAYSTGGTPVNGENPAFIIIDANTGEEILTQTVTVSGSGEDVMIGTPALLDTDDNGYLDHLFGATSRGVVFAHDLRYSSTSTQVFSGRKFYLTPNIDNLPDGNVLVVAVSGDSHLRYDEDQYPSSDFVNSVFIMRYDTETSLWDADTSSRIDLPAGHKAFARPKIIGNQLVLGTTTGDTFNFCDFDPDDPGDLFLMDLNSLSIENSINNFGSTLAPIIVSDGRVFAHRNTSGQNTPNEQGSVFRSPEDQVIQSEDVKQTVIAEVFGILGLQDSLMQNLLEQDAFDDNN